LAYSKELLKNAPPGVATLNIEELKRRKAADQAAKTCCPAGAAGADKKNCGRRRLLKALIPLSIGLAIGGGAAYYATKKK
jgi:hypothetical protein